MKIFMEMRTSNSARVGVVISIHCRTHTSVCLKRPMQHILFGTWQERALPMAATSNVLEQVQGMSSLIARLLVNSLQVLVLGMHCINYY